MTEAPVALCFLPSTWESSCSQSMDHVLTLTQRTYVPDFYFWGKKDTYIYIAKQKIKNKKKSIQVSPSLCFLSTIQEMKLLLQEIFRLHNVDSVGGRGHARIAGFSPPLALHTPHQASNQGVDVRFCIHTMLPGALHCQIH